MKISKKVRENFKLYRRCYREFQGDSFCPWPTDGIVDDPHGCSGLEWFRSIDCDGHLIPTREPKLVADVLTGKRLLNFNIKQWAEGIADGLFCLAEFQESYPWLPDWVWRSVIGAVYKHGPYKGMSRYATQAVC